MTILKKSRINLDCMYVYTYLWPKGSQSIQCCELHILQLYQFRILIDLCNNNNKSNSTINHNHIIIRCTHSCPHTWRAASILKLAKFIMKYKSSVILAEGCFFHFVKSYVYYMQELANQQSLLADNTIYIWVYFIQETIFRHTILCTIILLDSSTEELSDNTCHTLKNGSLL